MSPENRSSINFDGTYPDMTGKYQATSSFVCECFEELNSRLSDVEATVGSGTAFDDLKTQVQTNESDITSLKSEVADIQNDLGIASGATGDNTTAINNISQQVSTNTSDIATLKTEVATNTTDIATNASQISTNATNISTNTTAINANAANLMAITGPTGPIAQNTAAIASATGAIAQNTASISSNAANLMALTGATGPIAANTSQISGLTASVSGMSGAIASNTAGISGISGTLQAHIADPNNQHYNHVYFATMNNTYQMTTNGSGIPTYVFTSMSAARGYQFTLTGTTVNVTLPNNVVQAWPSQFNVPNGTDGVHTTLSSGNHGVTIKDAWAQFIAYGGSSNSTSNSYPFMALYTFPAVNAATPVTQTYTFQRVLAFGNYPSGYVQGQMCIASGTNLNIVVPPNTLYKVMFGMAVGNNMSENQYIYFVANINYKVNNP